MLDKIRKGISGKKTYLVAVGGIITALLGWAGETITTPDMINAVIGCILAVTLRSGVAKK